MTVLWILIPIALALGLLGLIGFLAATAFGQFDDLDTPPARAIFDENERTQK